MLGDGQNKTFLIETDEKDLSEECRMWPQDAALAQTPAHIPHLKPAGSLPFCCLCSIHTGCLQASIFSPWWEVPGG